VKNSYVLDDRDILAEHGTLIFVMTEDMTVRSISGHIFIESRGFVHPHEMMYVHKELIKAIRKTYEDILIENNRISR
jgi:mRNA degradation ribonuclease J1/J2